MQILQGIHHAERGPYIEMKRAVSQRSKIHQQNSTLGFLQRNRGIDGDRRAARAPLGIHHGEDARPSGRSPALAASGGNAGEGFNQGFGGGAAFQKFAGARPHRGHDGGGMAHFAHGKNRNVAGVGLNQFNGTDGPLRIAGIDIDDHNFCPDILDLAQHRVRGTGWESRVAEDISAHSGAFQAMLEYREPFPVF